MNCKQLHVQHEHVLASKRAPVPQVFRSLEPDVDHTGASGVVLTGWFHFVRARSSFCKEVKQSFCRGCNNGTKLEADTLADSCRCLASGDLSRLGIGTCSLPLCQRVWGQRDDGV